MTSPAARRAISRGSVSADRSSCRRSSPSTRSANACCIAASATGRRGHPLTALENAVDAADVDETLRLIGLAIPCRRPVTTAARGPAQAARRRHGPGSSARLLIMDEPTSGVSSDEKDGLMSTLMAALTERRVTSIFVEHDIDIVAAPRIAARRMDRRQGSPPTVRRNRCCATPKSCATYWESDGDDRTGRGQCEHRRHLGPARDQHDDRRRRHGGHRRSQRRRQDDACCE